jgi:hypothetical protein
MHASPYACAGGIRGRFRKEEEGRNGDSRENEESSCSLFAETRTEFFIRRGGGEIGRWKEKEEEVPA